MKIYKKNINNNNNNTNMYMFWYILRIDVSDAKINENYF